VVPNEAKVAPADLIEEATVPTQRGGPDLGAGVLLTVPPVHKGATVVVRVDHLMGQQLHQVLLTVNRVLADHHSDYEGGAGGGEGDGAQSVLTWVWQEAKEQAGITYSGHGNHLQYHFQGYRGRRQSVLRG